MGKIFSVVVSLALKWFHFRAFLFLVCNRKEMPWQMLPRPERDPGAAEILTGHFILDRQEAEQ